jgi:hypothetical protein
MASQSYHTISPVTRKMMRLLPAAAARPIAFRHVRKIAARYLSGNMRKRGELSADGGSPVDHARFGAGQCRLYILRGDARELLALLIGSIGAVEHVRCSRRGEGSCEWRADWRAFDRTVGLE